MKKVSGTMVLIIVLAILIGIFITAKHATAAEEKARDGRFIAYDNGTVLDTRTNLMWAAKDNGSFIGLLGAMSYINNYRGGGYTDWRIPTQDELAGLYDSAVTDKNGYHLTNLIELTGCCPSASETSADGAVYFDFANGDRISIDHNIGDCNRALPVRSVK